MVTERFIELVIGRLVTDEDFREAFRNDPQAAIETLPQRGAPMTAGERTALLSTDHGLWERVAEQVDPRLQKASLKP
jgi:hypothetical protein